MTCKCWWVCIINLSKGAINLTAEQYSMLRCQYEMNVQTKNTHKSTSCTGLGIDQRSIKVPRQSIQSSQKNITSIGVFKKETTIVSWIFTPYPPFSIISMTTRAIWLQQNESQFDWGQKKVRETFWIKETTLGDINKAYPPTPTYYNVRLVPTVQKSDTHCMSLFIADILALH